MEDQVKVIKLDFVLIVVKGVFQSCQANCIDDFEESFILIDRRRNFFQQHLIDCEYLRVFFEFKGRFLYFCFNFIPSVIAL